MTSQGKILFFVLIIALAVGGWYQFGRTTPQPLVEPSDISFSIDGTPITLVNGKSEMESAPGSATKIVTTYFGNEAAGDFNADGKGDKAFLVTQSTGGSGTFYYLATSLGGPALVLGDRIAPQTTEFMNGKIIVNYADRNPGEPMTAKPTVGVSRYFIWNNGALAEVESATSTATGWREGN